MPNDFNVSGFPVMRRELLAGLPKRSDLAKFQVQIPIPEVPRVTHMDPQVNHNQAPRSRAQVPLLAAGCCYFGCWLLAAAGCYWLLLAAAGCCWLLLFAHAHTRTHTRPIT